MSDNQKLFNDFDPITKEGWIAKAKVDLKGADFEKKLVWKTDDEILVQPFYTKEDLDSINTNSIPHISKERQWKNLAEIEVEDEKEANRAAVYLFEFGVEGFLFKLQNENIDFTKLLKDIDLNSFVVSFVFDKPSSKLVENYLSYANLNGIQKSELKGSFQCDILEEWSVKGTDPDFSEVNKILDKTSEYPQFYGLVIQSHSFINAGASVVQELAFTLNKLTDYIEKAGKDGLNIDQVVSGISFHLAIGGDYFFEIAKLRAFRALLESILKLYVDKVPSLKITSSNSIWSKSLYDPYVNMLRNTTEAMAAILGGCDEIVIKSHDSTYKKSTDFSRRIAANVSNLIKDESYFDKVADPAAGSYYLENLTNELTEKVLAKFQQIEDKGGFIKAFEQNIIQNEINALKAKKEKEISSRRRVFVGTNKYPNLNEKISSENVPDNESFASEVQLLTPQRATKSFEDLRQRTQAHFEKTGKTPMVYLACFGNLAMRKARAGFASELFGTGGFEVIPEKLFDSASEAAKESANSDADIVVMCSSDQDYEAEAVNFAELFRKSAKNKTLVLAGYPADLIEKLKGAGVDEFIHIKTDVIAFISSLQDKCFTKEN